MEFTAQYRDGVSFDIAARGNRLICDQPSTNGGGDAGMSPPEFMLASLASCVAYYALEYLRTRGLHTRDLEVRVASVKAQRPACPVP